MSRFVRCPKCLNMAGVTKGALYYCQNEQCDGYLSAVVKENA